MGSYKDNVFRANVGAMIINSRGQVLALERAGIENAWQLPQGGLEPGEEPWQGVLREVREETGLQPECLERLAEHPEWLAYELPPDKRTPKVGRGQVQKWFLLRLRAEYGETIPLEKATDAEFSDWKWMEFDKLVDIVVGFRQPLYRRLREEFGRYIVAGGTQKEGSA
ncbi:MAG TPA: RNA pyrophosphohydrolase [Patescibacteria group bacterium]|nr:RNA pyrophosphohydrolase [Patescibacteria group bacterium]